MAPPPMKAARLQASAQKPIELTPARSRPPIFPFVLMGLAALAVVGLIALVVALPSIVKAKCIAAAADRGVALTIGSTSIGLGGVRLVQVGFALEGVKGLAGAADSVDVGLSGLTPTDATATALAITIDGTAEEVQTALDAWRAAQAKKVRATQASGPANKLSFHGARVTWTRAFGATAKLEASDVSGDFDGGTNAVHFASEKVNVTAGRAAFGPWRATLDRDAQGTRTHVELDPVVRGGPQATYVKDAGGAVSLKVNVPPSPLSRIGVPAKGIGLATDPTAEMTLDFTEALSGTSALKTSITLTHATFSGMPLDAKIDLTATGDVTKGLEVKQGSLVAGPLRASITGTVKLFGDGARAALAWRTAPVPCTTVVKELATATFGPLGGQLATLGNQVGNAVGVKMTGDAVAAGLVTLDSRDVGATSTTMTTNETCGLAIF